MQVKITDYERIAVVTPTQLGQIQCPKCIGVCDERSGEKRTPPGKRREWDCIKCGRGWTEVPAHVRTVAEAHASAETDLGSVPAEGIVRVVFEHDNSAKKWTARVEGAVSPLEARQAFSAVVLTCQQLDASLLRETRVVVEEKLHVIEPAVRG